MESSIIGLKNMYAQQMVVLSMEPRIYLETTLVTAKGMVERAKQRIDRLCTFRTLMPEFYPDDVVKDTFKPLLDIAHHVHLPKTTKEHYRVYLLKLVSDNFDSSLVQSFYQYMVVTSEYLKRNDYSMGYVVVLDYRDANILNFVTKISPSELRQIITLMTEGYGMRIKRIDIISGSKMVDSLIMFFKQVLSAKLGDRIHLHKNLDTLYEAFDKNILPVDYGGKEKPLKELNEQFMEILCAKHNVENFKDLNKAKTDESCRQADKFTENYIGMPGSFRVLSVD